MSLPCIQYRTMESKGFKAEEVLIPNLRKGQRPPKATDLQDGQVHGLTIWGYSSLCANTTSLGQKRRPSKLSVDITKELCLHNSLVYSALLMITTR